MKQSVLRVSEPMKQSVLRVSEPMKQSVLSQLDDEAPTPVDWDLERKETIYYEKPKTGTESSSVPAPKSVLSDEEFDKLVAQHSMPSLADIYKKGLKQNVLRPLEAYAHKN